MNPVPPPAPTRSWRPRRWLVVTALLATVAVVGYRLLQERRRTAVRAEMAADIAVLDRQQLGLTGSPTQDRLLAHVRASTWEADPSPERTRLLLAAMTTGVQPLGGYVHNPINEEAREALVKMGPRVLPALIDLLDETPTPGNGPLARQQYAASVVLSLIDVSGSARPEVAERITRSLLAVRKPSTMWGMMGLDAHIARVFARFGPVALPPLYAALEDGWHEQRAVDAIRAVDPTWTESADAKRVTPAVFRRFAALDPRQQADQLPFVGKFGPLAADAVPTLVVLAASPDAVWFEHDTMAAMQQIGPAAIPHVIPAMAHHPDVFARGGSGRAARMAFAADPNWAKSDTARELVPELVRGLAKRPYGERLATAETIGHMGPNGLAALDAMIEQLRDEEWTARLAAVTAIGNMGGDAGRAGKAVARLLFDPDHPPTEPAVVHTAVGPRTTPTGKLQSAAVEALGKIGLEDEAAKVAVIVALADAQTQPAAREALHKYMPGWETSPAAKTAAPHLAALMLDPKRDGELRGSAANTLALLRASAEPALPSLITAVADPNPSIRDYAMQTLGHIGPAARSALPALRKALDSPDPGTRTTAKVTIQKIDK
ncbi:MAG: HEAT repeat domain-containing protein [Gemmataceae bacterium]